MCLARRKIFTIPISVSSINKTFSTNIQNQLNLFFVHLNCITTSNEPTLTLDCN